MGWCGPLPGPRPRTPVRCTKESMMIRIVNRCRDTARRNRTRTKIQPSLEALEDRRVLSALNGGHWYYPVRITYSFMPDGTSVGGVSSTLFQSLNAVAPTASWQQAFQKA